jgi:hypothetical protein
MACAHHHHNVAARLPRAYGKLTAHLLYTDDSMPDGAVIALYMMSGEPSIADTIHP